MWGCTTVWLKNLAGNLIWVDWQICERTAKLNSANIFSCMMVDQLKSTLFWWLWNGWCCFYAKRKSRQRKSSLEHGQRRYPSHYCYSVWVRFVVTTFSRILHPHSVSMSACKLDVLKHTFQPPYLHYRRTSIECSNCMGRAFELCIHRMAITGIRTHHCLQKQNCQIKTHQLELETNLPN